MCIQINYGNVINGLKTMNDDQILALMRTTRGDEFRLMSQIF
jgi:hypothetical protein